MKIKTRKLSYERILELPSYTYRKPVKQWPVLRWLLWGICAYDMWRVKLQVEKIRMERLEPKKPCLILMNHSCFFDMKIAASLFHDRPYQIVSTVDTLIGKEWLMRALGCIPTKKFITDPVLVKDILYALKDLKNSVIMYPEAGYSFDGTATTMPESLGKFLKILKVPVVMVRTYGAFHRNPLYNGLQLRKTNISVKVEYVLSEEDIQNKTPQKLNEIVQTMFDFDQFRWQQENKIRIAENFRADGLNRVLYKCPHCHAEGKMQGKGIHLICQNCKKEYELTEYGFMKAVEGETEFSHIPDWYAWERECVREELQSGNYSLDIPVDIYVMVNTKGIYQAGEGRLRHSGTGFHLTGCDGKLDYQQAPGVSYSINSDFFWYEIGDVICIGNSEIQYYCVPKEGGDVAAKTRLAAEELYKLAEQERKNVRKRRNERV